MYHIIHYSTCVPANGSAERIRHLWPHQVAIYLRWIRPTCTTHWISVRAKARRWFNKHDCFQSTQLVWHQCNVGNFDVSTQNKRICFNRFVFFLWNWKIYVTRFVRMYYIQDINIFMLLATIVETRTKFLIPRACTCCTFYNFFIIADKIQKRRLVIYTFKHTTIRLIMI